MYEHNALGYWSGLALCLTKSEAVEHAVLRQLLLFMDYYQLHVENVFLHLFKETQYGKKCKMAFY